MTHARLIQFLAGLAGSQALFRPVGTARADRALGAPDVAEVLKAGRLTYVAVDTKRGPFVTPVLYGVSGDRLWLVTRRGTLKARLLHARPQAGLLVRAGDRSVVMQGEVSLLEPVRPRGLVEAVSETSVAPCGMLSWVARNRREVFGFTVDAPRILSQLAPQNIVLVSFRPDRVALVRDGAVQATWGSWPMPIIAARTGGAGPAGHDGAAPGADATPATSDVRVLAQPLPTGLASLPDRPGPAVAGLRTPGGPLALPVDWDADSGLARFPAGLLAEAVPAGAAFPASLTFDEPGHTRPTEQRGLMLRGTARALGDGPHRALAIDAERVTYWTGFSTGTVDRVAPAQRAAS